MKYKKYLLIPSVIYLGVFLYYYFPLLSSCNPKAWGAGLCWLKAEYFTLPWYFLFRDELTIIAAIINSVIIYLIVLGIAKLVKKFRD